MHGRNRLSPDLRLQYSTGIGNGRFGLGWRISTKGVTRKTAKGCPSYDELEIFILGGAEDLVPIEELADGVTRSRPRTETTFARILHRRAGLDKYWEVKEPNGHTSFFGEPGVSAPNSATIVDPDLTSRIFGWKLRRTSDPFGNRVELAYENDSPPQDGPHPWDQSYLSEVRYVDYGDPEQPFVSC